MLLEKAQIATEGGMSLSSDVVARFYLRKLGLSGNAFVATLSLGLMNGQEVSAVISPFDLNPAGLPKSQDWQIASKTHGFKGDFFEYLLRFLQENQKLQLFFCPRANGSVMVRVAIFDQEAWGQLLAEDLAKGEYFLSQESVPAK